MPAKNSRNRGSRAWPAPTNSGFCTMQIQHRCFGFSFDDQMRDVLRLLHGLVYQFAFFAARIMQHVVGHFSPVAGMADAEAQPPKILAAEMRDDVLQPVVPAVPAAH